MSKLLLIHPQTRLGAAGFAQSDAWHMPPLALGYIAALTPPDWEIRIVDEYVEPLDLNESADLVGLSAYSANITRAYQLAGHFKARGVPVVMGGIHVSMYTEEALKFADAIVVGEAEFIWPQVLADWKAGRLQKLYRAPRNALVNLPMPRRDLFSDKYQMDSIIASRGCPFGCEFCSVTAYNGNEYRQRPVEEVLDELEPLSRDVVYFVDDNIFGAGPAAGERALSLFQGIVDRKIKKIWGTQASLNVADNEAVLEAAYASGCRAVYIGLESLAAENLRDMKKGVNLRAGVDGYKTAIGRIHKHGIAVVGSFIIGLDHDDIAVFRRIVDFMKETRLDVFDLSYLTPYPGTGLFDRLSKEGRLIYGNFPDDWDYCDGENVMVRPLRMGLVDLVHGFDYIVSERLKGTRIVRQFLATLMATRSPVSALLSYNLNKGRREGTGSRKQMTAGA